MLYIKASNLFSLVKPVAGLNKGDVIEIVKTDKNKVVIETLDGQQYTVNTQDLEYVKL